MDDSPQPKKRRTASAKQRGGGGKKKKPAAGDATDDEKKTPKKRGRKKKETKGGGGGADDDDDLPADKSKSKYIFQKELKEMMHGFGDNADPLQESTELMEEMVFDFISHVLETSAPLSHGLRDPLKTEHILFAVRHDAAKIQKADRLIRFRKDQISAKKADKAASGVASANAASELDALAAAHGDE